MKEEKKDTLSRFNSPLRLFFSLLLVIFSIEMLIMFIILPILFGDVEAGGVANIADSFLLTLLSAPYLWMCIVRPLRNAAMKEAAWTKTVLAHVVDGVVIINEEGTVESFNAAAEAIFGYTATEVTGLEMKNLLPERDIVSGNEGARLNASYEIIGRRKDGLLFPLDLSVSQVRVNDCWKFICIMRDISLRKQAEEDIRRLNKELEQKVAELIEAREELVNKEKLAMFGQLAENMGNDLRNPLGVMNNAVYFLKEVMPDADESVKEYLAIIKHEIDNSQRIISALIDFSRGKLPNSLVISLHEMIRQSLGKCTVPDNVQLHADVPETLPAVRIDPLQMGQVFQNLITNAVQAMPEGGALRVAARHRVQGSWFKVPGSNQEPGTKNQEPDADFIEISVADTGAGIAPEHMEKLFQPLFTTKARGIGLGLAFSKKFTEANDGRIEVESRLGEGTTFTVVLPVTAKGF